jgi:hypothetical protein
MTSFRQVEANRRNALRSTGPKTEQGKRQSRRNAVRHGLRAETVVATLEDVEDYRAFEAAITADYDAQTAVERELCCGWRPSCGASGAPPPSKPIFFRFRPKLAGSPTGARCYREN